MSSPLSDLPPPPATPVRATAPRRPPAVRALVGAAVVLAVAAGLGAVGGWVWWTWWSPGPDGRVFPLPDGGTTWIPQPAESGYSALFAATAQYAVLGVGLGVLVGLLSVVLCRRRELVGLLVAAAGSAVGAAVMLWVGTAQSPPDPESLLADAEVGDMLPGALEVTGWTPYLGWPVGALAAFVLVLLLVIDRPEPPPQR